MTWSSMYVSTRPKSAPRSFKTFIIRLLVAIFSNSQNGSAACVTNEGERIPSAISSSESFPNNPSCTWEIMGRIKGWMKGSSSGSYSSTERRITMFGDDAQTGPLPNARNTSYIALALSPSVEVPDSLCSMLWGQCRSYLRSKYNTLKLNRSNGPKSWSVVVGCGRRGTVLVDPRTHRPRPQQ